MEYYTANLELKNSEKELIAKIKKILIKKNKKYKVKGVKFNNKIIKGLRPNYGEIINSKELEQNLSKLSKSLAKKLKLSDPRLSIYNDLHSLFAVTWHRDDSSFAPPNPRSKEFYNEKRKILKFYLKTNFSFLDLMIKKKNNNLKFLKSNNKEIGFFDVRNFHQTYISTPFNKKYYFIFYKLTKYFNRLLVKIHSFCSGFDLILSSNFYFVIYEDCKVFRDYEASEIQRSQKQIVFY